MRDIALTVFVFGMLPFILKRPHVGILMWTWISLMSPGRLTWGFAYYMPYGQAVAITTLVSILLCKEPKRIPWNPVTVVWIIWVLWMCFTTLFALNPSGAATEFDRMIKIQLFCFLTLMFFQDKERLTAFIWVVVVSLGFFGIKGGIFTIMTGGNYRVWGPKQSFIEGNNELALALIMILPLLRFLQMNTANKWIRRGLVGAMALCAISAIGSQSRGAFLAIIAMGTFLLWKSRRRALMVPIFVILVPLGLALMPQHYWERIDTIRTYQEDASAMGRINAWLFAWNLVKDRPITGGGFNTFTKELFWSYAPNPEQHHDVHSIYFEALGEHGWPGLLLFLALGFLAYRSAGWTASRARGDPDLLWHLDLARMAQVCLTGYAVGGAFLGLAYFDLYYNIVIIIVMNRILLERRLAEKSPQRARMAYGAGPTPDGSSGPGPGRSGGGDPHGARGNRYPDHGRRPSY